MNPEIEKGQAYFSPDGAYRYALSRFWGPVIEGPMMLFVGLNPSMADADTLDPTLRRVVGFAQREGYVGIWVGNLFAFRATRPPNMKAAPDPVGPLNNRWLRDMAQWCGVGNVVAAWGSHGGFRDRDRAVVRLLGDYKLRCFGVTKHGHPGHPLYLPKTTTIVPFEGRP